MNDVSMDYVMSSMGDRLFCRQIVDSLRNPSTIVSMTVKDGDHTLTFPAYGDGYFRLLLQDDLNLHIAGGTAGQYQKMTVILQQPVTGNCELTFPATVRWMDRKPFIRSDGGESAIIEFIFDGATHIYGRLIYG